MKTDVERFMDLDSVSDLREIFAQSWGHIETFGDTKSVKTKSQQPFSCIRMTLDTALYQIIHYSLYKIKCYLRCPPNNLLTTDKNHYLHDNLTFQQLPFDTALRSFPIQSSHHVQKFFHQNVRSGSSYRDLWNNGESKKGGRGRKGRGAGD